MTYLVSVMYETLSQVNEFTCLGVLFMVVQRVQRQCHGRLASGAGDYYQVISVRFEQHAGI